MRVIDARNVHQALPKGVWLMQHFGEKRESRNGPVRVMPCPVTTVYERPRERMVFWAERDANPAFHIYEALWMLAGRKDLAPLLRYVKDFHRFSDDGHTLHGAYGYRWRKWFDAEPGRNIGGRDQLAIIARRLRTDPDDRRCVLQMWDTDGDLDVSGRDVPCNTLATFQVNNDGALDMTVFCRSNDIVLGAYGANAVHFSVLLEYMALWVGVPVGRYRQVSVNWHAYDDATWRKVEGLPARAFSAPFEDLAPLPCPYAGGTVRAVPMVTPLPDEDSTTTITRLDGYIKELLTHADTGFALPTSYHLSTDEPWVESVYVVLRAHELWRTLTAPERYTEALAVLASVDQSVDMIQAMREWLQRRQAVWEAKMVRTAEAETV
jgi:thymidylate synthase